MAHEEEHEGASTGEILIEACRRDNIDLLKEALEGKSEAEVSDLLNKTVTVMGNHLYHEAASRGNYDIIDYLLDQENFECDPISRVEGDTPLHTAVRWINSEPPAQREFGNALVDMMLEAGSNPRVKNKGGLTPFQLVDPRNAPLRELIQKHEYAILNRGDFVQASSSSSSSEQRGAAAGNGSARDQAILDVESEDDAEFSGSDDEERAEWERRRKEKGAKKD
ncbi:unnamed protein product [Discula destructiva]